ncbi:MAG: ribonuclease P protein component [Treponema sp.]|nr:ribonuclease P protein component [Treponema sp.]
MPYNRICFTFAKFNKKNKFSKDKQFLNENQSKVKQVSWNAVARNRVKRISRETFRLMKPCISGGHDLIFLVYPDYLIESESLDVRKTLESLLIKAGLFK